MCCSYSKLCCTQQDAHTTFEYCRRLPSTCNVLLCCLPAGACAVPPTLCNLYQHGGDLLYLQVSSCTATCTAAAVVFNTTPAPTASPACFLTSGSCCSAKLQRSRLTCVKVGPSHWALLLHLTACRPGHSRLLQAVHIICTAIRKHTSDTPALLLGSMLSMLGTLAHMYACAALQMLPGQVKWLTEQPMFFISGIWSSSLVKLYHFGAVKLGLVQGWWGSDGPKAVVCSSWHVNLKFVLFPATAWRHTW